MFEQETPEAIKARILTKITKSDTREGSYADDMVGPVAVEISKVYSTLEAMRYIVWVDETSGIYLDLAAEDLGIEPRKAGIKAKVERLVITGTAGFIFPAEYSFFTDNNLYYVLEETAEIPEGGKLTVSVVARETGTAYNTAAHTIKHFSRCDARLESVDNPEAATGGTNTESDISLYRRIDAFRKRPATSGNELHYEQWAMEVPGVGIAKAQGLWDGPGTVKVLVADEDSQPVDERIRESCAAHIESERPIGPEVTVRSVSPFVVNISAQLWLKRDVDIDDVARAFRENLAAYFKVISLRHFTVLYNRIGSILSTVDGVVDYGNLVVNGTHGNITINTEQVPVVGEVSFACRD